MTKRIVAMLLCLVMLLSSVPTMALATEAEGPVILETQVQGEPEQAEEPAEAVEETAEVEEETKETVEQTTESEEETTIPVEETAPEETVPETTEEPVVPQETVPAAPEAPVVPSVSTDPKDTITQEGDQYYFTDFWDLQKLVSDHANADYTIRAYYVGEGPLIIETDIIIPENISVYVQDGRELRIPADVVMSNYRIIYVDNLVVNGILLNYSELNIYKSVSAFGAINNYAWIYLYGNPTVTGKDNIYFYDNAKVYRSVVANSAAELVDVVAQMDTSDPNWSYKLYWYIYEDAVLDQSLTIPAGVYTLVQGNCTATVAAGCTLNLDDCSFDACSPLRIEGTLVNNGHMEVSYGHGAVLTVVEGGQYSGKGRILARRGGEDVQLTDIIQGLNLDNFAVEDHGFYWELTSLEGKERLAAPTDLTWHKEWIWDEDSRSNMLVDHPGMVAFKPAAPNVGDFDVYLYRETENGYEWVYGSGYGNGEQVLDWISDDLFIRSEPETGNYYFSVIACDYEDNGYGNSPEAKSEVYHYVKPSAKMPTPKNLTLAEVEEYGEELIRVNWESEPAETLIQWYFCKTPQEDPVRNHDNMVTSGTWYTETYADLPSWFVNDCGNGYYYCRVRTLPDNIEKVYLSDWSEISEGYHVFDAVSYVKTELARALESSRTPEQARAAAQAINQEYLRLALNKDKSGEILTRYAQLEDVAGGPVQVKTASGFAAFSAADVSVVGANLNTPAAGKDISLTVGKPAKTHTLPGDLDIPGALRFSMNLENAAALTVPAMVTLPVPQGISSAEAVVLYHSAKNGNILLKPVAYSENSVTVLVTELGDFTVTADIFTQEEFLAEINEAIESGNYGYSLTRPLVLTEDLTLKIEGDRWINISIEEGGSLTIPAGVTCTMTQGDITIFNGSMTVNGQLNMNNGTVSVITGTLTVGSGGKVNAGGIMVSIQEGGEVVGLPKSELTVELRASSEGELRDFFTAYKDVYGYLSIGMLGGGHITLTQDLEIPYNANLWFNEVIFTVPSGITLHAKGSLHVNDWATLNIEKGAKLINESYLMIWGEMNLEGTYDGAGRLENNGTINGKLIYLDAGSAGRSMQVIPRLYPEDPNVEFVWEVLEGKDYVTLEFYDEVVVIKQKHNVTEPKELRVKVSTKDGKVSNTFSGWVYPEEAQSGTCGKNLTWTLDGGVLTISGTGAMEEFSWEKNPPWFEFRDRIEKIVIENGVTSISSYAFHNSFNLESVTIPSSITSIGAYAFEYCNALKSVQIPAKVTSIGTGAFSPCERLTKITVSSSNKNYCSDASGVLYDKDKSILIQAPGALSGDYKIPDSVTIIGAQALTYCKNLTSLKIPNSVKTIGEMALCGLEKVTSLDLPDGITELSVGVLAECTGLKSIKIPESVTKIGYAAFYYCKGLTSIKIPANVKTIDEIAFMDCQSLTSVTFTGDAPEISADAFQGVKATAYYPSGNATWTAAKRANYGGTLTWEAKKTQATALATPVLSVKNNTETGKPILSWDAIQDADAYEISRATSKTGKYTKIVTTKDETYTDTKATAGKTYYYKVKAVCAENSKLSSKQSAAVSAKCLFAQPVAETSNNASGYPVIKWNKITGAKKYDVYYKETGKTTFKKLATTASTSYTHSKATSGKYYEYQVRAYGTSTSYAGAFSEAVTGIRKLAKPAITVTVNNDAGTAKITWKKITGANSYELQCSVNGGEFEPIEATLTAKSISYTHAGLTVGNTYTYRLRALSSNEETNSDYSAEKKAVIKCGKPTLKVTNDPTTGKPVLSWNAVESAESYEIQVATSSKGKYKKLDVVTDVTYTHTAAAGGKTYYYKVCARDAGGNAGAYSTVKSVSCKCAQPVVTVQINASTGKPVIKWAKVTGAKKYTIYRSTVEDGTYKELKTVTTTSYTDTTAGIGHYYYKVKAIASTSTYNSAQSEMVPCIAILAQPALTVSINTTTGKPTLSWKKIPNANGYEVYRAESADGEYIQLPYEKGLTYTDTTAAPDTEYWYKVNAVAMVMIANSVDGTPKRVHSGLAKPSVTFKVDDISGKPVLTWNPVEGAVAYKVYRSTSATKSFKEVQSGTETTYTDTSVAAGKGYYYKVIAIGEGSKSAYSTCKKLTGKCSQPVITVAPGSTGKPVVKWGKVSGAKKYEVYRATSETGKYTKVTITTSLSYTDSKATFGNTYYYRVKAIGSKTAYNSGYSAILSCRTVLAQPALTVKAVTNTGKPSLFWKNVSGASVYEIYRSVNDGAFELICTAENTQSKFLYVDEEAVLDSKYSYKIKAIAEDPTLSSTETAAKTVWCVCAAPEATVKLSGKKPMVSWEAVEGAVKYEVYRSTKSASGYKKVATVTGCSYTDTKAAKNKTYYYKVVARSEQTSSAYSDVVKIKSK